MKHVGTIPMTLLPRFERIRENHGDGAAERFVIEFNRRRGGESLSRKEWAALIDEVEAESVSID